MLPRVVGCCALWTLAARGADAASIIQAPLAPPALEELPEDVLVIEEVDRIDDAEGAGAPAAAPRGHFLRPSRDAASLVETTQDLESAILDEEAPKASEPPNGSSLRKQLYPNPHKLLERALDGMPEELQSLAEQQVEQGASRRKLQASEQQGITATKEGQRLRRELAKLQANIFVESRDLKKLERQREHLKDEHASIDEKLKTVMGPRIASHEKRLLREQRELESVEKELHRWQDMTNRSKGHALAMLRERKSRAKALEAARKAVADAEAAEEKAQATYEDVREKTSQSIEEYKYSKTRLQATTNDDEDARAHAADAKAGLDRLHTILGAEEKRLSAAIEASSARVERRIEAEEAEKAKATSAFEAAKKSYASWEEQQRQRAEEARSIQQQAEQQQEQLDNSKLQVLRSAGAKVGRTMEGRSHWDSDDWAWTGGGEGLEDSQDALLDGR